MDTKFQCENLKKETTWEPSHICEDNWVWDAHWIHRTQDRAQWWCLENVV